MTCNITNCNINCQCCVMSKTNKLFSFSGCTTAIHFVSLSYDFFYSSENHIMETQLVTKATK